MNAEYLKMARMSRTMMMISSRVIHNERSNASEIKSTVTRFENGKKTTERFSKWVEVGNAHGRHTRDGWAEDVSARHGDERTYHYIERKM